MTIELTNVYPFEVGGKEGNYKLTEAPDVFEFEIVHFRYK